MPKIVVLLSGGLDSSTLLTELSMGNECYPLTLLYGQKHQKEVMAARNVCEYLGLVKRWKMVNLEVLRGLLPSVLTGKGEIPEGAYDSPTMSQTVVPGRNLIFLAIAIGWAQGLGATAVAYAAHCGDHPIYPDCRTEFIRAAAEAAQLGYGIELLTPYDGIDKVGIVKRGLMINVPYHMTWSCYKGGSRPCLRCGTCVERTLAFKGVGVADPTLTSTEWEEALSYAASVTKS